MRVGGSRETPSPAREEAKRILKGAVGFVGICAAGCWSEELIPVPDGKTEKWGDPMLLPSRQHSQGPGAHPRISPCCKLRKNASSPGFHVKWKLFGARAVSFWIFAENLAEQSFWRPLETGTIWLSWGCIFAAKRKTSSYKTMHTSAANPSVL